MKMRSPLMLLLSLLLLMPLGACKGGEGGEGGEGGAAASSTIIAADGSSTVYPITEAVAEAFGAKNRDARVTIGVSGTGGGFKKFCSGETQLSNASRPIKPSEVKLCADKGIEYVELPVAYDGISVVISPDNTWVDHLTVAELKTIWAPESQGKVQKWSDVRAGWPEEELHLFGPGVDSGTYDYFTKAIVGKEHASRGDYTSSEDDNVLVQGVATDKLALGFFGYAYFKENRKKLKAVPIKAGPGPAIAPSAATVADGTYQPLSRPIFIYLSKASLERAEVKAFADFYVAEAKSLVPEVGYIALPDTAYALVTKRLADKVVGSVFDGKGSTIGASVESLLSGG